jgi:pyruvate dehydrogenase E2 component (dihydrolipoamide acetyltransferase)
MSSVEVKVPDMGNFETVTVIDVLVKPGDTIDLETPLVTLETDKATMDVPSTAQGVVEKVHVAKGGKVSTGGLIVTVKSATTAAAAKPASAPTAAAAAPVAQAPQAAAPAAPAKPTSIDVTVPDMGGFDSVSVIDVLVKAGDAVDFDTPLATLETDKATMDVPSTAKGVVEKVHIAKGGKVSQGALVVTVKGVVAQAAAKPAAAAAAPAAPNKAAQSAKPAAPQGAQQSLPAARAGLPAIDEASFVSAHASPSVRKFARELGVNLGSVRGSGEKGRIQLDDVKAFVKLVMSGGGPVAAAPALPKAHNYDPSAFGAVEIKPLNRVQKISGPRLQAAWINIPHVTQFDESDITDLEALRGTLKEKAAAAGVKVTPLAFIIQAAARAMREFPVLNSQLDEAGQNLIYKKFFNVGFAADTPNGLLVPVIKGADKLDVFAIAKALADLSLKAREGKLPGTDMQGAGFTISSLGGIGGTLFTPIINSPEVAILGVSKSAMKPVWDGKQFQPRLMLPLSFSYDHRVIDGALGARIAKFLADTLAKPADLVGAMS